jgi:PIN domain nuclease of toxin-antitoxin system
MTNWVLDASAILAIVKGEAGAERVAVALETAILSAINASEVVARLITLGSTPDKAVTTVRNLGCTIVPVDAELGLRAGELVVLTRSKGLSLGDRICLALAEREGVPALTADRAWAELGLDIKVSLIR